MMDASVPGQRTAAEQSPPVATDIPEISSKAAGYGLRQAVLSPVETLAQSISFMCPTLTPFATLPLVFALAGNATWLAYVLATGGVFLLAWCISRFAGYIASPGSLYTYAALGLPSWLAAVVAWSSVLAAVAGSTSNICGFYYFANAMLSAATGHTVSAPLLAAIVGIPPVWMAWRDIRISARVMLSSEAISITLVCIVMLLVLSRHGLHGDPNQLHFRGVTGSGFREGLVFAFYSFIGFEGATALGCEARNPLKTIPRAVMLTAVVGGLFFILCAFTEVLGFGMSGKDLGTNDVPMHILSTVAGIPVFGFLIDLGALVTLFAGILAGVTGGARILLMMAHEGLAPSWFKTTHPVNKTPTVATIALGFAICLPASYFAIKGANGLDVYGWFGMLAVYGSIASYGLVCLALPPYLRECHGVADLETKTIPYLAFGLIVLIVAASLYPAPQGMYARMPFVFLAVVAIGLLFFVFRSRAKGSVQVAP
jgi:amino acid transporter